MGIALSRRQFLRGDFRQRLAANRPPWSLPEAEFLARCTRCGDCLPVCETGILRAGDGGFPEVNFHAGECSFCRACVTHCPTGALNGDQPSPWTLTARIGDSCLARRGVLCRVCADPCPTTAIRFPATNAVGIPEISSQDCNGCGACVAPCPAQAITLMTEVQT